MEKLTCGSRLGQPHTLDKDFHRIATLPGKEVKNSARCLAHARNYDYLKIGARPSLRHALPEASQLIFV